MKVSVNELQIPVRDGSLLGVVEGDALMILDPTKFRLECSRFWLGDGWCPLDRSHLEVPCAEAWVK